MVSVRDVQRLMREIYYERDSKRGVERTYMWLVQEIGELGRAILRNDRDNLMEEVADVLAWLASLCNLLDVDLEDAVMSRYPGVCPKCRSRPCRCSVV